MSDGDWGLYCDCSIINGPVLMFLLSYKHNRMYGSAARIYLMWIIDVFIERTWICDVSVERFNEPSDNGMGMWWSCNTAAAILIKCCKVDLPLLHVTHHAALSRRNAIRKHLATGKPWVLGHILVANRRSATRHLPCNHVAGALPLQNCRDCIISFVNLHVIISINIVLGMYLCIVYEKVYLSLLQNSFVRNFIFKRSKLLFECFLYAYPV